MISMLIVGFKFSTILFSACAMYYVKTKCSNNGSVSVFRPVKFCVYYIEDESAGDIINILLFNSIEECFYFTDDLNKKYSNCICWTRGDL